MALVLLTNDGVSKGNPFMIAKPFVAANVITESRIGFKERWWSEKQWENNQKKDIAQLEKNLHI